MFRPLCLEFKTLLERLDPAAWTRPTVAPAWRVRDVVAHLIDTMLRRLSSQRDGYHPPPPVVPIDSDAALASFINELNASWVTTSQRLSPTLLTQLFVFASAEHAALMETMPLEAPPLHAVSWAGSDGERGWLDIGREFTEQWHHQMQVRDAVGGPAPSDAAWLRAVLRVAMCGLPHAWRDTDAPDGASVAVIVHGDAGGAWSLSRERGEWVLGEGVGEGEATARCEMSDDAAWRLLFNALPRERWSEVRRSGDADLLAPLLRARSVVSLNTLSLLLHPVLREAERHHVSGLTGPVDVVAVITIGDPAVYSNSEQP